MKPSLSHNKHTMNGNGAGLLIILSLDVSYDTVRERIRSLVMKLCIDVSIEAIDERIRSTNVQPQREE